MSDYDPPVYQPPAGFTKPHTATEDVSTPQTPNNQTPPKPPHKKNPLLPTILGVSLVSALLGGGVGGGIVALNDRTNDTNVVSTVDNSQTAVSSGGATNLTDLSGVVKNSLPSIVTVSVVTNNGAGTGSGVVLNRNGYIVTNAHVATLAGQTANGNITVQTSEGSIYTAELVGFDPTSDLAVLKIDADAKGIQPIMFASSEKVQVGSGTIAIGSPLGLSGTVTTGVISALNRPITVQSSEIGASNQNGAASVALSAIQTDAAINPGNSGGALLDDKGHLIGINVAIASSGGGQGEAGNIGVGFAIPSDYVKRITGELIDNGKASHALLGASLDDYAENGTAFTTGAVITALTNGSAAAEAGIQEGDVVVAVDGSPIESATQLVALIKQQAPDSNVTITYLRNNREATATVTLDEA